MHFRLNRDGGGRVRPDCKPCANNRLFRGVKDGFAEQMLTGETYRWIVGISWEMSRGPEATIRVGRTKGAVKEWFLFHCRQ